MSCEEIQIYSQSDLCIQGLSFGGSNECHETGKLRAKQ